MGVLIRASEMPTTKRRNIYRRHRDGQVSKLAPGIFVPRATFDSLEPWDRFQLRCAATGYGYPKYTLVGKAAAAIWGIPYGDIPGRVELARLNGHGGLRTDLVSMRRLASIPGQPPQLHRGVSVTTPLQTVLDLGRWHPLADAVTAADHCLHHGLFTLTQLSEHATHLTGCKGVGNLKDLLLLVHGASESPRESALRVAMWENGFPAPHLQASIIDESGRFLGRADALFADSSVLVEYDGRGKYRCSPDQTTEQALMEERRREKDLLNLGTRMIRVTAETFTSGRWIHDLRRELDLGKGRPLDQRLWTSQGLGWGRAQDKQPSGSLYPRYPV
ncbi:hypothetical protein HMPREF0290_0222 [Corynebacterium efficiens YS-314]|nr:hypothetical protein HMPREF0290_0222 [Corynebacterium efficiens YS-314]